MTPGSSASTSSSAFASRSGASVPRTAMQRIRGPVAAATPASVSSKASASAAGAPSSSRARR